MTELNRWQTLVCGCGSTHFTKALELRYQRNGGLTENIGGYRCLACHKDADVSEMLRQMTLARKRQELVAMEQEIAEHAPTVPASSPA